MYKTKKQEDFKFEENIFTLTNSDKIADICNVIFEKIETDINNNFKDSNLENVDSIIEAILKLKLNEQLYLILHFVDVKKYSKILKSNKFDEYFNIILILLDVEQYQEDDSCLPEYLRFPKTAPTEEELNILDKFEIDNNIQLYVEEL